MSRQLYLPDTAILVTRFMTPDGVGEVHDFMPYRRRQGHRPAPAGAQHQGRARHHEVPRSTPAALRLRPDAAQARRLRARRGLPRRRQELSVSGIAPVGVTRRDLELAIEPDGGGLRVDPDAARGRERRRRAGVQRRPAATAGPAREAERAGPTTPRGFWRDWLRPARTYRGRWREMVARSAMTLKLMTYAPDRRAGRRADRRACPSRSAASATGTTGTPGSGTPRSPSTRCSAWATWRRRPSSAVAAGPGHRAGRQRLRAAEDHVPGRRLLGPDRGDPRPLRGLARLAAGAHRQRRGRPAPARHLRRGHGRARCSPTTAA